MSSISSTHGKLQKIQQLLNRLATFFKTLKECAEQLTPKQRWYRILSKAIEKYLQGRKLQLLLPPACFKWAYKIQISITLSRVFGTSNCRI